ncbi:MAG: hypothetical protein O9296_12370, partial [Novosphingobium sp.]|nr:hypothetical protein [Novosphingobium sp.]
MRYGAAAAMRARLGAFEKTTVRPDPSPALLAVPLCTGRPDADGEEARTLRPLQAAAVTYRIAFGSRAGQKVLTLRGAMPREVTARQALCAEVDGFSLHAAVRVEAHERKRLE